MKHSGTYTSNEARRSLRQVFPVIIRKERDNNRSSSPGVTCHGAGFGPGRCEDMTTGRRNPAIYVGLLGAATGAFPTNAMAISLEELVTGSSAPYIQFALGVIAGASLSTAAHIAFAAITETKAKKANAQAEAREAEERASEKKSEAEAEQQEGTRTTQKPIAASKAPARHMAAREWEASGVIRVQDVSVGHARESAKAQVTDPAASGELQTKSPAHVATDYSDIAENYVRRKSLRERMTARTSGVAVVLSSRLGTDPFEGLPIIERADGTVGDVGTSWWNKTLGSSIRRIEDISKEEVTPDPVDYTEGTGSMVSVESVESAESAGSTGTLIGKHAAKAGAFKRVEDIPEDAPMPQTGPMHLGSTSAAHFELNAEASRRADYISKNVAEVNVGVYPEHRTAEDLEHEDVWDLALKAMDERLNNQSNPVFRDAIGTIETIDEPDGLEGSTSFIPFKMHAGHPEMVDTSSYVDYLIDDEFSQNPSPIARRTSRDYLTVIQGGGEKGEAPKNEEERVYRPKHFAPAHTPLAREA